MICLQCQKNVPEDALKCSQCGAPIERHIAIPAYPYACMLAEEQVPQLSFDNLPFFIPSDQDALRSTDEIAQLKFPTTDEIAQLKFPITGKEEIVKPQFRTTGKNRIVHLPPPTTDKHESAQVSLVPVPPTDPAQMEQQTATLHLHYIADEVIERLLPDTDKIATPVHIAPLYRTRVVRAPLYRIISGFLSVLIVAGLLCASSVYFVQRNGLVSRVTSFWTGSTPVNMRPAPTPVIADPPREGPKDRGPAFASMPSATTALYYDERTNTPRAPQTVFKPGEVINVLYTLHQPKTNGHVVIKWYTNGHLYISQQTPEVRAADLKSKVYNGVFTMRYDRPAQGMAELYWNDTFARRLYFAVR